ncbi:helix-turn-helix domain-containing protein [Terribacillus sp. JSM ZJ617]|uniref:helix-turn-helix domain-containing protein n=1 Tax=Terribacillus sp. JSM ZJ617 TaxID=3342119 RepID=UPI0035A83EE2
MALRKGRCRLSDLLEQKRMSQVEFAEKMGVSKPTVSRWVAGERYMKYDHAVQAAFLLSCHAEDFYEWIEG